MLVIENCERERETTENKLWTDADNESIRNGSSAKVDQVTIDCPKTIELFHSIS